MLKNIVRHGNTHAITLDQTLMQLTGIDPEGQVDVRIEKGKIVIRPKKAAVGLFDESILTCKVAEAT